jgi:hypothetical protein
MLGIPCLVRISKKSPGRPATNLVANRPGVANYLYLLLPINRPLVLEAVLLVVVVVVLPLSPFRRTRC